MEHSPDGKKGESARVFAFMLRTPTEHYIQFICLIYIVSLVRFLMSSRNPGPQIQRMPLGFSSFSPRVLRDQQRRRAFFDSEVNTRIYKAVYESLGVKGKINWNKKVGETKINLRCIHGGATNGVNRYTNMSRFGMLQAQQEGWLLKYGYVPDRFH